MTFTRSYKQGEEWRTATNFSWSDILVVAEVARLAYLWVTSQTVTVRTPLPQTQPPVAEEVPM
ncbi:MAG: hypothetical protein K2X82_07495 [Gemmataceae bacterium]|nr:hypothetical protein [Gemmataceae bacterium]